MPSRKRLLGMRRLPLAPACLMLPAAAVIGFVAPYAVATYPLTILVLLMWVWSFSRWVAGLVLASYYAGATWVAVPGWQSYSDLDAMGTVGIMAVWLALLLFACLPWVLLHRTDDRWLMARLTAVFVITVLPPVGLVQLANPFTGAALILPGVGWLSIAIGLILTSFAARSPRLIVGVFACLVFTAVYGTKERRPGGWQAFDTEIPHAAFAGLQAPTFDALQAAGRVARTDKPDVLLLGESTMGASTKAAKQALGRLGQSTVILGAHDHTSTPPRSVLAVIGEQQADTVYRQRVPVPFAGGLWPLWASPVVSINGRRVAPLICFEGVSSWATISALAMKPEVVAVLANGAWTTYGNRLEQALHAHVSAWAAVFDRLVVVAINRRPSGQGEG